MVASRSPVQAGTGWGGSIRFAPNGAAAYGMPRNADTPDLVSPRMIPSPNRTAGSRVISLMRFSVATPHGYVANCGSVAFVCQDRRAGYGQEARPHGRATARPVAATPAGGHYDRPAGRARCLPPGPPDLSGGRPRRHAAPGPHAAR